MTSQVIDTMTRLAHDQAMTTAHGPTAHTSTTSTSDRPLAPVLLQAWAATMAVFGLAIATVSRVRGDLFEWIAFGTTDPGLGLSADARDYLVFNQALMGALTAGLGVALVWLARAMTTRDHVAWWAFVTALGTWFVIDCVGSLATGFGRNVVFNAVLVAPAVPLLWSLRPAGSADS